MCGLEILLLFATTESGTVEGDTWEVALGGWGSLTHDTRGVAMTEFAIIMPMLLALILGIVEFGHFVAVSNAVETAAREGARYGSVVGIGPNGLVNYVDCIGIRDAARENINLVTIDNADVTVFYDEGPGTAQESYNCNGGPFPAVSDVANGSRIIVTVEIPYDPLLDALPLVGKMFNSKMVGAEDRRSIFPGNL